MPIHRSQNQYRGVNAHLHSEFQTERDSPSMWPAFHAAHISHLADALNDVLPPQYQAVQEQSLAMDVEWDRARQIVDEPYQVMAVTIYRTTQSAAYDELGEPIVRIELFSPSNKAGGDYFKPYQNNRQLALHSGLVLVEIDYLHESASPIPGFPRYPVDEQSYPYNIIISDPRLPPDQTAVFSYGFAVDVPVPALNIPLSGADAVLLDFNAAYQRTFVARRWGKQVDYEQEPERLGSYRADDRAAIRARMQAVAGG